MVNLNSLIAGNLDEKNAIKMSKKRNFFRCPANTVFQKPAEFWRCQTNTGEEIIISRYKMTLH